jgi:hypothetical protein
MKTALNTDTVLTVGFVEMEIGTMYRAVPALHCSPAVYLKTIREDLVEIGGGSVAVIPLQAHHRFMRLPNGTTMTLTQ